MPATLQAADDDVGAQEQAAFETAVDRVAPAVVRIETIGGLEQVEGVLIGSGPTTGLIVAPKGYIISSAFNFVGKPASILVRLADGRRKPARLVATDHARMLVLLKIDPDKPLPTCQISPCGEMRVGQWAIAVGRTFDSPHPNMAVGILSALDRVWGKAIQTDAAVSPNNYGGPLVDVRGRVLGVLVPLSPESADEVAGMEWYDSGIGFAVPMEHIRQILPRLEKGEDLYPGVLGVSLKGSNLYTGEPIVAACRQKSPAALAGIKPGDRIVEIEGRAVARSAELREALGRRYAGDTIRVTVLRGKDRISRDIKLTAKLEPFQHGFLGILPVRGPEEEGVRVRYVYPKSPAAAAGIVAGDVLVSLAGEPIEGRLELLEQIGVLEPGTTVKLEFRRGAAVRKIEATLATLPDDLPPDDLPPAIDKSSLPRPPSAVKKQSKPVAQPPSAVKKPSKDAAQPKTARLPTVGARRLTIHEYSNEIRAYVPEHYAPDMPCGVVVWLHAPGGFDWKDLLAQWKPLCDRHDLILVAPKSSDPARWLPAEAALVGRLLMEIASNYAVDPARVAVHGYEGGGSLAFLAAQRNRDMIRAVAAVEASPVGAPFENDPVRRLAVYMAWADKSSAARTIERSVAAMRAMKIPVTVKNLGDVSRYLDAEEVAELARWIDTLDRI
jgi:serine protease Do